MVVQQASVGGGVHIPPKRIQGSSLKHLRGPTARN